VLGPDSTKAVPRTRTLLLEAGVAKLTALVAITFHLRLWRARWSEPFTLGGDASFYLMETRSLGHFGSYLSSPNLGWPFGQSVHDLPQGVDNINWLILKVLYAVSGSVGGAINGFYILSFGAVAATAMAVFRLLGMRRWLAFVLALLYSFAPYHFARSEGHLLLSGYFLVPIGVLLALLMFRSPPLVRRNAAGRVRIDWRSRRSWLVILACVGLASTGSYYLMFSLGLVVIAAALAAATNRSGQRLTPLISAGAIVVVAGFAFALNVSPTLRYMAAHGQNPGVAQRSPIETELYGLRVSQLVLPREQHWVHPLAEIARRSQGKVVPSEPGQQLGAIGAFGFMAMLVAVAAATVGRRRTHLLDDLSRLGVLAIACVLAGTVSGFSVLISAAGMSYIRAWNRISVVIAFVALLAVGCILERLFDRRDGSVVLPIDELELVDAVNAPASTTSSLDPVHGDGTPIATISEISSATSRTAARSPLGRRAVPVMVAVGLLGFGYLDQTGRSDLPQYAAIHQQAGSNGGFFASVASTVGPGGAVFTWPYVGFPEVPDRGGTGAYDQAMGYVYQPDLKWSFGFARGRHPDYPLAFESQPASQWLTSVVAIGFGALVVDRAALTGKGAIPDVEPEVQRVLAKPSMVSADGRYALYDLASFTAKIRAEKSAEELAAIAAKALAEPATEELKALAARALAGS
jgi:hypothetical protein